MDTINSITESMKNPEIIIKGNPYNLRVVNGQLYLLFRNIYSESTLIVGNYSKFLDYLRLFYEDLSTKERSIINQLKFYLDLDLDKGEEAIKSQLTEFISEELFEETKKKLIIIREKNSFKTINLGYFIQFGISPIMLEYTDKRGPNFFRISLINPTSSIDVNDELFREMLRKDPLSFEMNMGSSGELIKLTYKLFIEKLTTLISRLFSD